MVQFIVKYIHNQMANFLLIVYNLCALYCLNLLTDSSLYVFCD